MVCVAMMASDVKAKYGNPFSEFVLCIHTLGGVSSEHTLELSPFCDFMYFIRFACRGQSNLFI